VGTGNFPLLETTLSRTDITDSTVLQQTTNSYLAAVEAPVVTPVLTFSLDMPNPQFGSYLLGDDVRVVVPPDEFFMSGYDGILRIVQWDVTVNPNGVSTVALTLNVPPSTGT
jgi:hypothetical protein